MGFYYALRKIQAVKNKKPKQISAEKLSKIKAREGRTLALWLIAFAMFPEESAYWTKNWTPRVSVSKLRKKRPRKIYKIGMKMKEDPRRLAA